MAQLLGLDNVIVVTVPCAAKLPTSLYGALRDDMYAISGCRVSMSKTCNPLCGGCAGLCYRVA